MTERNRVLVVPYTKKTKVDLEATLLGAYTSNGEVRRHGWWDDSKYNTARSGDGFVVVDNKTKEVLFTGEITSLFDSVSLHNHFDKLWQFHDKDHNILLVKKVEPAGRTHLKDYVTKTGRVQGTTLRYGIE